MRSFIIFSGFLPVMILITSWAWSQEEMTQVDNSVFKNPGRPQAVFVHDTHNEMAELDDCAVCHHVYDEGKRVPDESSEDSSCSDCHGLKKSEDNGMPLVIAFHKRCRNCHFQVNKGPVLCGECHIRGEEVSHE